MSRPVLRYHGGKFLLADWLVSLFPPHRTYVEPFGGAASVLMKKPRSYAEVYNDLDDEVVNVFRVLRELETAEALRQALSLTPFSRRDFEISYEPTPDPVEQARRTIIRAFMGFGSNAHHRKTGFRANSNRSGTTPARDWLNYPKSLEGFTERLQGVVIEGRDALDVIQQHDGPETLHYVDPPYVASTRDGGSDYSHEMTDQDHAHLAAALHGVAGMVVLSGYDCDLYRDLYRDWVKIERKALADGARERVEAVWLNPKAEAGQSQLRMFG